MSPSAQAEGTVQAGDPAKIIENTFSLDNFIAYAVAKENQPLIDALSSGLDAVIATAPGRGCTPDWVPRALPPGWEPGSKAASAAIARALALSPQIMFFDEATSALDPELVKGILALRAELAAKGMTMVTMVAVTHEMDFARSTADSVMFMDRAGSSRPDHRNRSSMRPRPTGSRGSRRRCC